MQEIKFRAWYTYRNSFYVYGSEAIRMLIAKPNGSDVVLEQYTGLKDKNGVEIYEGDVLELQDECWQDRTNIIGTVQYEAPRYTFISVPSAVWCSIPQNAKVISNIHDNPELLEEK